MKHNNYKITTYNNFVLFFQKRGARGGSDPQSYSRHFVPAVRWDTHQTRALADLVCVLRKISDFQRQTKTIYHYVTFYVTKPKGNVNPGTRIFNIPVPKLTI